MITLEKTAAPATKQTPSERVPFRVHPRVFAALGSDLITNDIVAVIELVKNSYDAFAHNVWIAFKQGRDAPYLEITDDGIGMTKDVIENSWCTVATPHKEIRRLVRKGNRSRRVVGNKGLGRLSAARLGNRLTMLTQSSQSPCWEVNVNWTEIASGNDIAMSAVALREETEGSPFSAHGTRLRIYELRKQWDEKGIKELAENLGRLISPFAERDEFNITLLGIDNAEPIDIEVPRFLSEPKYSIKGAVDAKGNVVGTYEFAPIGSDRVHRTTQMSQTWSQIHIAAKSTWKYPHSPEYACCGPFTFEIRAWDINADGTGEISDRYGVQKRLVRSAIRAHKGISVYRDGVLALPKSEGARDWLGLDLRRVSQIGRRLSTSQVVGYVSISAEKNPKIEDTSDRERLSMCAEVEEFEALIRSIVGLLESGRNQDREEPGREQPLTELFANLSADKLVDRTTDMAQSGANASEIVKVILKFSESLNRDRQAIETRFVYYSRLATVGSIAQMLIHEIRNRTTAIGSALNFFRENFGQRGDQKADERIRRAEESVSALEALADKFAPLASRNFRSGRRHSVLEDCIRESLDMYEGQLASSGIKCVVPKSQTTVAVDPGLLSAVIINLTTNALYWLESTPREERKLEFETEKNTDGTRVTVFVHDTGPGLQDGDEEKILLAGVTRKPNGVGMGLTVASETVAAHGGDMIVIHPGVRGGASFKFDLPCVR